MKKILLLPILLLCGMLYAQTNVTVSLDNEVYGLLQNIELRGYCSALDAVKPYTEKYIVSKLEEALDYLEDNFEDDERRIQKQQIQNYIDSFEHKAGKDWLTLHYRKEGSVVNHPVSFEINDYFRTDLYKGIYSEKDDNAFAWNIYNTVDVSGDLGNSVSYRSEIILGATKVQLKKVGEYDIGYWYSTTYNKPGDGTGATEYNDFTHECAQDKRLVSIFRNYACLPFGYNKFWDGSVYAFEDGINAGGLEGWPNKASLAFGMKGEIRGIFLDDLVELSVGRMNREWCSMENGSSLVLNANARPFFAGEAVFKPFKWLSVKTMTGVLEMPNRKDMLEKAFYPVDSDGKNNMSNMEEHDHANDDEYKDYHYFQNAFSIGEVDLDFKYVHLDFGSTCVWPKRFELGYSFPLIDRVVYQNDVGDYDNCSLYGNFKIRYPGVGYGWFSFYLDELNAFLTKFWKNTRAMYAFQLGAKIALPEPIPFGTFTFRYTKIEPYCYTHQSINGTPWYNHYINENYSNNGYCLGYYLQPNSSEILVRLDCSPDANSTAAFQYQLITHGAEFGSQQVPGSNLYSELPRNGRGSLRKNFLFDGAYEWTHLFTLAGSYKVKARIPVKINATAGFVYDYFSTIDGGAVSIYEHLDRFSVYEDPHHAQNDEYYDIMGGIFSLSVTLFGR